MLRQSPPFLPLPLLLGGSLALASSAFAAPAPVPETVEGLMEGKVQTERSIELVVVLDGSPEQLFQLWTTTQGVNEFFGNGSRIEPRLGGLYEIDFGVRPDGQVAGPRGTRIRRYEPGEALDFEWEMPYFARELNTHPLPTWVEVRFDRFSEEPERTQVRVTHHGFGASKAWNRSYEFFQRNWFDILFRLKLHTTFFSP